MVRTSGSTRVTIPETLNDVREPLRLYYNLEIWAHLSIFSEKRRQGKRAEHTTQAMLGELMPAPTTETSRELAPLPPAQAVVESEHRPETSHSDADESLDSDDDEAMDGAHASDDDADGSQDSEGDEPRGEGRLCVLHTQRSSHCFSCKFLLLSVVWTADRTV